jgi:alpha-glucosidase
MEIKSPNGRIKLKFLLDHGQIGYAVEKDEKTILRKSLLGLSLLGMRDFGTNLQLVRTHSRSVDHTWETHWGEQREIRDNYSEKAFYLAERTQPRRLITVRFRVFDDGIAFRYEIPPQPNLKRIVVADELTEFAVDTNSNAWSIPAYQPDRYEYNYERRHIHEMHGSVHTPLTIESTTGHFLAIHEAALYNYGSMTIKLDNGKLRADITPISDGMRAYVDLPFSTPWRTVIIGHDAKDLTVSRMVLNLNDPPKGDFGWVKPLKFLGIWWAMFVGEWTWAPGDRHGATTQNAKDYIDACHRLGIPGLLIEGWNDGWEGDWLENGEFNKFMEPAHDFDADEVARYAKANNVSLIGHHETVGFVDNYEKQLEGAYQYMRDRDIHYIKSGYVGSKILINGNREFHHSQIGVLHYQKALELAAKYKIMLDVHEPIKGTGIERTWPNLMTREGARGQEYEGGALSPSHACILPFTRLLAGGMDYTPGIFDVTNFTKRIASTISRQLAYYVTIYSSMHMAADRPRFYEELYPEPFKFIRSVPVDWEKTVPLLAEIGEYYVVARQERGGDKWFIGGVTNEVGRRVDLYIDFLESGVNYAAEIYRDSDDAHYRNHQMGQIIEQKIIRQGDLLNIYMAPGGGFAIRLRK